MRYKKIVFWLSIVFFIACIGNSYAGNFLLRTPNASKYDLPRITRTIQFASNQDADKLKQIGMLYDKTSGPGMVIVNPVSLRGIDRIVFDWDGTLFSSEGGLYDDLMRLFTITLCTGIDFRTYGSLQEAVSYINSLPHDVKDMGNRGAQIRVDTSGQPFANQTRMIMDMIAHETMPKLGSVSLTSIEDAISYFVELKLKMSDAEKLRLGHDSWLLPGAKNALMEFKRLFPGAPLCVSTGGVQRLVEEEAQKEGVFDFFREIRGSSDNGVQVNPDKTGVFIEYGGRMLFYCDTAGDVEFVKMANAQTKVHVISIGVADSLERAKKLYLAGVDIIISGMDANQKVLNKILEDSNLRYDEASVPSRLERIEPIREAARVSL